MTMPGAMSTEDIERALRDLPGWSGNENGLEARLEFEDFRGAMQFMQACVEGIERLNHHPVWKNKFNAIDIHLDTFDIGHKVTSLDVQLARYFRDVLKQNGERFGYVGA